MHRIRLASLSLLLLLSCSACDPKPTPGPGAPGGSGVISFADIDPLLKARDPEPAKVKLEALLAVHGPEPTIVCRLSRVYRVLGDTSRAVEIVRKCLDAHADAARVWLELADIYSGLDVATYLEKSRDAYLKARELGIPDKELALPLGSVYGRLGKPDEADAEFARARTAGAEEKVVLYNMALVRFAKKDWAKARELLEQAIAKDPAYPEAKRELARVLLQGNPTDPGTINKAMNLIWEVKDVLAEDWNLYEIMGDGWMLNSDWDAAVEAYTNALKFGHNPKQVEDKYREAATRQKAARKAQGGDQTPPKGK